MSQSFLCFECDNPFNCSFGKHFLLVIHSWTVKHGALTSNLNLHQANIPCKCCAYLGCISRDSVQLIISLLTFASFSCLLRNNLLLQFQHFRTKDNTESYLILYADTWSLQLSALDELSIILHLYTLNLPILDLEKIKNPFFRISFSIKEIGNYNLCSRNALSPIILRLYSS